MRGPDLDKERSEKRVSLKEFLAFYNAGLPPEYPKASLPLLRKFVSTHPELFKHGDAWSLDQHRKKVMDWLPAYIRANAQV
jgi:hypothetical protein